MGKADAANLRGRLDRILDLGRLTSKEIHFILGLMQEKYGFGYSDAEEDGIKVGQLQAKLSIMMEAAGNSERLRTGETEKRFDAASLGRG